ncbi:hypothetical protein [Phyllobacterium salinisoli]|nr:hypothetical protein [Phyllobacterium salinisoli]
MTAIFRQRSPFSNMEEGARSPTRVVIVPIDAQIIYKTLRRVRSEEARGNRKIHRVTVPVPMERAIELGPDGEGLSNALDGMRGGPFSSYLASKIEERQTCGFDGSITGHFLIPGEDAEEKVHSLFLGKRREVDVVDFTVERRRFGIPLENDTDFFREAVLEFHAPSLMSVLIELEDLEEGTWTRFPVDMYAVPPFVDASRKAPTRFANAFFEVTLDFEKEWAGIVFDDDGSRSVDLSEAVTMIEVGAILARSKKRVKIEIGGGMMELPAAEGNEGPFHNWIPVAPILRRMETAIDRYAPSKKPRIQLSEFYDWIEKYQNLLALGSVSGANLFFPRWEDDTLLDGQDVVLAPLTLQLAGTQYTALIEVPIETESHDTHEIRIVGGHPRIVDDIARAPGSKTADFINRAVELSKRNRKVKGPALVLGSFE